MRAPLPIDSRLRLSIRAVVLYVEACAGQPLVRYPLPIAEKAVYPSLLERQHARRTANRLVVAGLITLQPAGGRAARTAVRDAQRGEFLRTLYLIAPTVSLRGMCQTRWQRAPAGAGAYGQGCPKPPGPQ